MARKGLFLRPEEVRDAAVGPGFLEKVYENALAHELRKAKVNVVQQQGIEVFYDGVNVGNYEADLLVEGTFGGESPPLAWQC